jgi:hypothetical protein
VTALVVVRVARAPETNCMADVAGGAFGTDPVIGEPMSGVLAGGCVCEDVAARGALAFAASSPDFL